jgi:hypothetical protein
MCFTLLQHETSHRSGSRKNYFDRITCKSGFNAVLVKYFRYHAFRQKAYIAQNLIEYMILFWLQKIKLNQYLNF